MWHNLNFLSKINKTSRKKTRRRRSMDKWLHAHTSCLCWIATSVIYIHVRLSRCCVCVWIISHLRLFLVLNLPLALSLSLIFIRSRLACLFFASFSIILTNFKYRFRKLIEYVRTKNSWKSIYDLHFDIPFAPLNFIKIRDQPKNSKLQSIVYVVKTCCTSCCCCYCCCCYTCLLFNAGSKTMPKNVIFLRLLSDYHHSNDSCTCM